MSFYDLRRAGRNSEGLDSEKGVIAILDSMVNLGCMHALMRMVEAPSTKDLGFRVTGLLFRV